MALFMDNGELQSRSNKNKSYYRHNIMTES